MNKTRIISFVPITMLAFNLLIAAEKKSSGVQESAAPDKKVAFTVDRFGQTTLKNFPGKIKDESELKNDALTEDTYYKSLKPPVTDVWGGLPNSQKKFNLKATGFFHTEKHGERWILVDPAGNAFFHLGVTSVGFNDDYTTVEGRREMYEWLPPVDGDFKTAWMNKDVISFYIANCIRKYGSSFDREHFIGKIVNRLKCMGFNSIGAFSDNINVYKEEHIPYVMHADIHSPNLPGLSAIIDPFDENSLKNMDEHFARLLVPNAKDSLIIGYFFANEQPLEDISRVIPKLPGKYAAKQKLVELLKQKYGSIAAFNSAWGQNASDFAVLADLEIPVSTQKAFNDMREYTALFLDKYFSAIAKTFRKYDQNHLMIGNRFTLLSANSEVVCRAAGKYMDVISINNYTSGIDKAFLQRAYNWSGKPQIWSEWYYSSEAESNVGPFNTDMKTQKDRGLAYRNYVETGASLGFVLGSEWFELGDEAATGRWFDGFYGEHFNTGIFNVADRPYRDMIAEMLITHNRIYDVWLNGSAPYQINDPRFLQQAGKEKGHRMVSAGHVVKPFKIDGTMDGWPRRPPERIGSDRVVTGTHGQDLEATFKICWDEKNLYLLTQVTDHSPMNNSKSGGDLWNGDGVELFIGSEHLDQGGTLLFSDHQLMLGAGREIKGNPWYLVRSDKQPEVQMTTFPSVDGDGYTLEAAVPWNALGITPRENLELLFDLAVDDAPAGGERTRQLMWNGSERNSIDRTYWGRLRLEP